MRSIQVLLAVMALSAATTAFAAASGQNHVVSLTNDIVDTIDVSSGANVSFTALGLASSTDSAVTLAYSTHSDHLSGSATTTRKVTVVSTALPTGVTGTVTFNPASGNGSGATAALGTAAADLVTAIPQYITQNAADLNYSFVASKGFTSAPITVTYTLADE